MPHDPRKREKAVMKRRRQQKESAKARQNSKANALDTPRQVLRHVRSFPVYECLISRGWDNPNSMELVQILLARKQPDGDIACAVYLVDPLCLGLKNTLYHTHYTPTEYEDDIKAALMADTPLEPCPVDLAHQMIYGAIAYAAQFGFQPNRDWVDTQLFLEPRGALPEVYDLTFGRDGKPCFVAGPYDNIPKIVGRLERNPGPGNYDYIVPVDEQDLEDLGFDVRSLETEGDDDRLEDLGDLDVVETDSDSDPNSEPDNPRR